MSVTSTTQPDLARLDEIAQTPASAETDDRVLELVERMADEPDGPQVLIDRFIDVPNTIVPRAISFVLAERAVAPSPETWRQTLDLVGRLRGSDDPSTLINGLTAIQRHLMFLDRLRPAAPKSHLLDDFLLHCLAQPPLVQSTAIDVLILLDEDHLLIRVFGQAEAIRLRRKLTEIAAGGEADRGEELDRLIASLPAGGR